MLPTGTDDLHAYLKRYNLELDRDFWNMIGVHPRKQWSRFVTPENRHIACPEAIDLLDKMLVYDHQRRILPKEAMEHPYFRPVVVGPLGTDIGIVSPPQQSAFVGNTFWLFRSR